MPSSVIRMFDYDAARRELNVVFQSGRRYVYQDVPPEHYEGLTAAPSIGEYFNDHIRENYRFERR